jgi:hypothetical protein
VAAERKAFLLRLDPKLLEAMQRWANDDLRSLNAQMEFVLRQALAKAGRKVGAPNPKRPPASSSDGPPAAADEGDEAKDASEDEGGSG